MIFFPPAKKIKLRPQNKGTAKAPPKIAYSSPIQTKIGFEFEVGNWLTMKPEKVEGKEEPVWTPLKKNETVLRAPNFVLKADEHDVGSDLEICTVPFEENKEGYQQLKQTMRKIICILESFEPFSQRTEPFTKLEAFGRLDLPDTHLFLHGSPKIKPQATFGLELDQVPELMEDIGKDKKSVHPALKKRRSEGRKVLSRQKTSCRYDETLLLAEDGMEAFSEKLIAKNMRDFKPSEELMGLVNLILLYLIRGSGQLKSYAKTIGSLLARTDFARLFQLLPENEKSLFTKENGLYWMELMKACLDLIELKIDLPVFEKGIYWRSAGKDHHILKDLSRKQWLTGIPLGTDYLTEEHFPNREYAEELESLGSWHEKTEPSALSADGQMPIFELRTIRSIDDFRRIEPIALHLFRYIYSLNRKMGYKFGEEFSID
ncbi:MAG: hypothetical protein MI784_16995 [Cytophagales bacterium]|nr:hypothetical protein [Cytophagales bacterium]